MHWGYLELYIAAYLLGAAIAGALLVGLAWWLA